jgi:hypothetical protein
MTFRAGSVWNLWALIPEGSDARDSQSICMRNLPRIGFAVALLIFGICILQGSHLFNRNRLETAKRASCVSNLREIGRVLRQRGLPLVDTNREQISIVLNELRLSCPSRRAVEDKKQISSYFPVETDAGRLIISESSTNHDPRNIRFNSLSATRFFLRDDWSVHSADDEVETRNRVRTER